MSLTSEIRLRILIVEDVPEMQEFLSIALEAISSRLTPSVGVRDLAANVMEARRLVHKNRPHLVLLDEVLPGESSLDLLLELHSDGIPVLMLTGMDDPQHPIPPQAAGRLVKPAWSARSRGVSPQDLERILQVVQAVLDGSILTC